MTAKDALGNCEERGKWREMSEMWTPIRESSLVRLPDTFEEQRALLYLLKTPARQRHKSPDRVFMQWELQTLVRDFAS
jgi:hypothetical protein